jgi:hypothetical protein
MYVCYTFTFDIFAICCNVMLMFNANAINYQVAFSTYIYTNYRMCVAFCLIKYCNKIQHHTSCCCCCCWRMLSKLSSFWLQDMIHVAHTLLRMNYRDNFQHQFTSVFYLSSSSTPSRSAISFSYFAIASLFFNSSVNLHNDASFVSLWLYTYKRVSRED